MRQLPRIIFFALALIPAVGSYAALTLQQIREKYPIYDGVSDRGIVDDLQQSVYPNLSFDEVAAKFGYKESEAATGIGSSHSNHKQKAPPPETGRSTAEQDRQIKILTALHPDWKEIVDSDDFSTWTSTLSDENRNILSESWNALEISELITRYKKDKNSTASNLTDDSEPVASSKITENPAILEENEFNSHEFLKKFVAHLFIKLPFAIGIFQLLAIGIKKTSISSAHQQGCWLASWLVGGSVLMTSLAKLDNGDYANFFAFFFLQIVCTWSMGYLIGLGWFRLKSWQSN